ncbi:hypothetical protein ANN_13822 [Periplaneta americana]|uniref:Transposase Tc1-like domain-containing protein n=1 Tax=Periplaneta americana TaxID=6978 RepID=A0ABQ8SVL1_PERAM|nr:hypothetical protein ANN_13822 [Periplaneta americana]
MLIMALFIKVSDKMRHLNEFEMYHALLLLRQVQLLRQVARVLEVSPSVVSRLRNRHRETAYKSCKNLQNDLYRVFGIRFSDQTIRNRLRKENIRPKRPVRKQLLTNEHKTARLTFAENHADWNLNHWQSVLLSDESRYRLTRCDDRLRVWERPGERFSVGAIQEIDRFVGGSIMVWAGIMYNNRTDLVIVVAVRKIRNRYQAPQILQELGDTLKEEWENIPQEEIQNLIGSMPRRCQAVIECRGGHTRY